MFVDAFVSCCLFYQATDKVALLIGQSCYRGNSSPLPAVINDIYAMRKKLEEMQFKVISLVNLDLGEMRNAVSWFCEMLSAGAYGARYYLFIYSHCFLKTKILLAYNKI